MRVALFFDGKNHMKDLRRASTERWLDHGALASWAVEHVGGTDLIAAHYYTGVPNPNDESERHALSDLLDELERRPGFFVHRFNRRATTRECPHCNVVMAYTEEKMVDTSLVVDLVMYAVKDAFDIAIVFSGDLDLAPGVKAVHAMGKRCWIATFGTAGLSRSLTRAAWGAIDLMDHIDAYSHPELGEEAPRAVEQVTDVDVDRQMLRELRRAEAHFSVGGGFVGGHYFIHRWKGRDIPDAPELRRQSLQRLMASGLAETYQVDGKTAVRPLEASTDPLHDDDDQDQDPDDAPEDETSPTTTPGVVRRRLRVEQS